MCASELQFGNIVGYMHASDVFDFHSTKSHYSLGRVPLILVALPGHVNRLEALELRRGPLRGRGVAERLDLEELGLDDPGRDGGDPEGDATAAGLTGGRGFTGFIKCEIYEKGRGRGF